MAFEFDKQHVAITVAALGVAGYSAVASWEAAGGSAGGVKSYLLAGGVFVGSFATAFVALMKKSPATIEETIEDAEELIVENGKQGVVPGPMKPKPPTGPQSGGRAA